MNTITVTILAVFLCLFILNLGYLSYQTMQNSKNLVNLRNEVVYLLQ